MGFEIFGFVKVAAGVHEYFMPPPPSNCEDVPAQILVSFDFEMTGKLLTVTFTESVFEHPTALVTVTKYVVVDKGVATGFGIFGLEIPGGGAHW